MNRLPSILALDVAMKTGHLGLIAVLLVGCNVAEQVVPRADGDADKGTTAEEAAVEQETQPAAQEAAESFDHTHRRWNAILKLHVEGDRFDYAALAKERGELDAYLGELSAVERADLESWAKPQRFAFWINAYNAFTILKVIDNLPLDSIRDLDKSFGLNTVFEQEWIPLKALHPSGKLKRMSLNDIEHTILRERFKDARIHAAVNCASISCPPLLGEAFVPDRLDAQLSSQMRAFVADRVRNTFNRDDNSVRLSKIFDWFADDFKRDTDSVRDYLVRFASEADAEFLREAKLKYASYDWDLNAPKKK
ncbi:MAG: hypothetical protein ACI82F_002032 [Planctomycetota bacterium]|jgi:hypothetical protein